MSWRPLCRNVSLLFLWVKRAQKCGWIPARNCRPDATRRSVDHGRFSTEIMITVSSSAADDEKYQATQSRKDQHVTGIPCWNNPPPSTTGTGKPEEKKNDERSKDAFDIPLQSSSKYWIDYSIDYLKDIDDAVAADDKMLSSFDAIAGEEEGVIHPSVHPSTHPSIHPSIHYICLSSTSRVGIIFYLGAPSSANGVAIYLSSNLFDA